MGILSLAKETPRLRASVRPKEPQTREGLGVPCFRGPSVCSFFRRLRGRESMPPAVEHPPLFLEQADHGLFVLA
jgi:hypothetical protein